MSMFDEQLTWSDGYKEADRHIRAAVISAILSLGAHVVFIIFLCDTNFDLGVVTEDMISSFHVDTVNVMGIDMPEEGSFNPLESQSADQAVKSPLETFAENSGALIAEPDKAVMEPPAADQEGLMKAMVNLFEPKDMPELSDWQPRQEILQVERSLVADDVAVLARRKIPKLTRIPNAPSVVYPVSRNASAVAGSVEGGAGVSSGADGVPSGPTDIKHVAGSENTGSGGSIAGGHKADVEKKSTGLFDEDPSEVTSMRPIENLLKAEVEVYSSRRDFRYGYFRMEIRRAGAEVLPVLPKDVMLVQDCSASITEQRLYFCRSALIQCLSEIGPKDRFNVVGFRDKMFQCSGDWMPNNPRNIDKAVQFVSKMKSSGDTDIFASMKELLLATKVGTRPVVMILVTDGRSTTGMTKSSKIIGELSKLNKGSLSVFTMGTISSANGYLLDLLSYSNRGESEKVEGGRWGIPESMKKLLQGTKRPVLNDVSFLFPSGTSIEVFPKVTGNLYLDRPLVLYGRYPKKAEKIVLQAFGKANNRMSDMLFDIPIKDCKKSRDKDMRKKWAGQKIYSLIGDYTRKPSGELLKEISSTSKKYNVDIPHLGEF